MQSFRNICENVDQRNRAGRRPSSGGIFSRSNPRTIRQTFILWPDPTFITTTHITRVHFRFHITHRTLPWFKFVHVLTDYLDTKSHHQVSAKNRSS